MPETSIRFTSYPRTEPPPAFVASIVEAFRSAEVQIGSEALAKGLTSDAVLAVLHPQLEALGFQVEKGKVREQKIERPVFFGENGVPALRYQIDAYHPVGDVNWRSKPVERGWATRSTAISFRHW